jgi:hypothetical protein
MLVELGFGALLAKALWTRRQNGKLTPERETAYLEALEACRGPEGAKILRKTADIYARHGLPVQAKMLRARADYIDAPFEVKQERAAIIEKARRSFNVVALEGVAAEFEKLTATGIAQELRERVRRIKAGEIVAPAAPPAAKPEPSSTPAVPSAPVVPIVPPSSSPSEEPPPAAARESQHEAAAQ